MTEEALLARKKRSRAGHRASATRIVDQAMGALDSEPVDIDQLTMLKMMLDEKKEILSRLDSEVAELVPDEELENEIHRIDKYKEQIYGVLTKLNKALVPAAPGAPYPAAAGVALTDPPADRTGGRTPTLRPPAPDATHTADPAKVKLPKISLPRFNGNLMRWTAFWDSYHSAIHQWTAI